VILGIKQLELERIMSAQHENYREPVRGVDETKFIQGLMREILQVRESHPDWFYYFEDVDPDLCSREELIELMRTAPTPATRHFLHGKFTWRVRIAAYLGREF
jgi:hypothetical protein